LFWKTLKNESQDVNDPEKHKQTMHFNYQHKKKILGFLKLTDKKTSSGTLPSWKPLPGRHLSIVTQGSSQGLPAYQARPCETKKRI
jgi:hypothetical protein